MVSSADILHELSEAVGSENQVLYVPAVKSLGVILSTNDHTIIDRALWANLLTKFGELIESIMRGFCKGKKLLRDICWALSNLTAGNSHHVDAFTESKCLEFIVELVLNSNFPVDARKEGLWVLCNGITTAEPQVKYKMVSKEPRLMSCLVYGCKPGQDLRLLKNILESIYDILELDNLMPEIKQTDGSMAHNWELAGGLDTLEDVQKHPNMDIYKAAGEIILRFFPTEED